MQKAPHLIFREARREDVPRLVEMLADDPLGAQRERYEEPLPETYFTAFEKKRPEALAFYEKLGFRASHEGMKLHLVGHGS